MYFPFLIPETGISNFQTIYLHPKQDIIEYPGHFHFLNGEVSRSDTFIYLLLCTALLSLALIMQVLILLSRFNVTEQSRSSGIDTKIVSP